MFTFRMQKFVVCPLKKCSKIHLFAESIKKTTPKCDRGRLLQLKHQLKIDILYQTNLILNDLSWTPLNKEL